MKPTPIKISIIIPVYNVDEYIYRCLDSITSQSLKEIEIIVIDDGSTDHSWEIVREFANKDSRIIAIRQRNKGVSAARNTGLAQATGEYIGFVDADDYVDMDYFRNLYYTASQRKADITMAYVEMEDKSRQHFYNYTISRAAVRNKYVLVGVVWRNIYRTSMLRNNKIQFPLNLRTAEDNIFNLQASYYANKVVRVDSGSAVYHQTTRQGSLTTQQRDSKNLVTLSRAVLETVKNINSMKDYDEGVYIMRVVDVFSYFFRRFIESEHIGWYNRYRISLIFVRVWQQVRYRQEIIESVQENDINPRLVMYGSLAERLYDQHVVRLKDKKTKPKISKDIMLKTVKTLPKKTAKFILPHGIVILYQQRLTSNSEYSLNDNKIAIVAAYKYTDYIKRLKKSVEAAGYQVTDHPGDAKYVWLHWYENGVNDYSDFLSKVSMISEWKAQGKKVIMHIHNKKPHESSMPNLSHALVTSLYDSADHVSIMSAETKKILSSTWYYKDDFSHVSTIPHPNYVDVYGKKLPRPTSLNNDKLRILFFGLVRPYKGIEKLLEATDGLKNVEVSIFGKPADDKYVAKLKKLAMHRDNVNFRLEHIPNDDIPQIFANHHIVALPYSVESSLNSGAAILAFSYARTVVGTKNGTLKELGDGDLYFGYDYKDEQDHVRQLKKTIEVIQSRYDGNYNELLKIGNKAYRVIKRDNSIEAVADSIKAMIERIG